MNISECFGEPQYPSQRSSEDYQEYNFHAMHTVAGYSISDGFGNRRSVRTSGMYLVTFSISDTEVERYYISCALPIMEIVERIKQYTLIPRTSRQMQEFFRSLEEVQSR